MLGKNNLKNIRILKSASPSMLIEEYTTGFSLILYVKNKEKDYTCIGTAHFDHEVTDGERRIAPEKLDGEKAFSISGYSGAYPGFGELLYMLSMMEIQQRGGRLLPDQRGVSEDAIKLYKKLFFSNNVRTFIKEKLSIYEGSNNPLNATYEIEINSELKAIAKKLQGNHIANNLSKDEKIMLLDQAYDLGENLLEENKIIDRKSLMENLKKGYPQFQIDADINEEMSF